MEPSFAVRGLRVVRQEPDTKPDPDELDEADRACREINSQVERARQRLLREYSDILREGTAESDRA